MVLIKLRNVDSRKLRLLPFECYNLLKTWRVLWLNLLFLILKIYLNLCVLTPVTFPFKPVLHNIKLLFEFFLQNGLCSHHEVCNLAELYSYLAHEVIKCSVLTLESCTFCVVRSSLLVKVCAQVIMPLWMHLCSVATLVWFASMIWNLEVLGRRYMVRIWAYCCGVDTQRLAWVQLVSCCRLLSFLGDIAGAVCEVTWSYAELVDFLELCLH